MKLHIVGGFLGSGKTTAIARALCILARRGTRAGVVTNDQGKSVVDGLFMSALGAPAVEVSGGCFCCRYEDFGERLAALAARDRPEIVFAESVGSCADLVATVVRPIALAASRGAGLGLEGTPTFSVFADARLLAMRLEGRPLPFSEDLAYLFDRQLEEAGLVVAGKADLAPDPAALVAAYRAARPGAEIRAQCSRDEAQVGEWLALLEADRGALCGSPVDVDYARYGRAEASLAWADAELVVESDRGPEAAASAFRAAFADLEPRLRAAFPSIGHCKALLFGPGGAEKLSFATLAAPSAADGARGGAGAPVPPAPRAPGGIRVVLNLRVEGRPERLEAELRGALGGTLAGASARILSLNAFSPSPPAPPPQRIS